MMFLLEYKSICHTLWAKFGWMAGPGSGLNPNLTLTTYIMLASVFRRVIISLIKVFYFILQQDVIAWSFAFLPGSWFGG